jgi:hypothetical protein
MYEALADLGFRVVAPVDGQSPGLAVIPAQTPDGRSASIAISPQNAMTIVRVTIGPCHLGDDELSRALLRRVALNFGTVLRAFTPLETTLPRRINPSRWDPTGSRKGPPDFLDGDGRRPGAKQAEATELPPSPETVTLPSSAVPDFLRSFVPTIDFPNPPNLPYSPFPYTPF